MANTDQQQQINALTQQNQLLQTTKVELENRITTLNTQNQCKESQINDLQLQISELNNVVTQKVTENEQFQQEITRLGELENRITTLNTQNQCKESQINDLQLQISELNNVVTQKVTENEQFQQEITRLGELENRITTLNTQNQLKDSQINDLQLQISELTNLVTEKETENEQFQQEITRLTDHINEQNDEKSLFQENFQNYKQNSEKYLTENTVLKEQNFSYEKEIKQISTRLNEVLSQLQAQTENYNKQLNEKSEELQELQAQYNEQQLQHQEFQKNIEIPKSPVFKSIKPHSNKIELYFLRDQSEIIKQNDQIKIIVRRVDDNEWEKILMLNNPKEVTINGLDPDTRYEILFQGCKIINGEKKFTKTTDPITVQTLVSLETIKAFNKQVKSKFNHYQLSKLQRYANQKLFNIMLLGGIGQGKTSVHNILVRYLQGKGAVLGQRPGSSGQSDTQQFSQVYLNTVHNILIQDFWGFSPNVANDNYDKIAIKILQKGATENLKYENRLDLQEMEKHLLNGDLNSQTHLGLISINISKYQGEIVTECQKLIQLVRKEKIPLLIILTHFDKWYENLKGEPFQLETVPKDLIQQCKQTFIEINRQSNCDIVPDQNDIQVMICSQDGSCSKKAIKQLALITIDNMMKMAYNFVHQLIKSKLCIINQFDQKICSLHFPNRNLNLQELEKEVAWNLKQNNIPNANQFAFLDERSDKVPISPKSYASMRVEDISFPYSLEQDKSAQVIAVRIQLQNCVHSDLSVQIMNDKSQQQFENSKLNKATQGALGNDVEFKNENQDDDNDVEEENHHVAMTRQFLEKMKKKKSKNGKKQIELRKDLYMILKTEDNQYTLVPDDIIEHIRESNLDITLLQLQQNMDAQYQNENLIEDEEDEQEDQDEDEENKDNSQQYTHNSTDDSKKPASFYKERQFVRLLNYKNCKEGDLVEFEYISNDQLQNIILSDILMGQNIITIESKEQQEVEKTDLILLQDAKTQEFDLLRGKFTSVMHFKEIRTKYSKQYEKIKKVQFLDKDGKILKYNKEKNIIKNDNLPISEGYEKKQFIVLKYISS